MAVLRLRLEMLLKNTSFTKRERQFISHGSFFKAGTVFLRTVSVS